MILVEASPRKYLEKYIYGEEMPTNKAQRFGKKVAEALAGEKDFGEIDKDVIISLTPNLKLREFEILIQTKGKDPITILAKLDGISEDFKELIEHKTGPEGSWTQEKADKWPQITFYCMVVYLLKGIIPKVKLIHIVTAKDENGEYYMTGTVRRYLTERTLKDILIMQARTRRAWNKIGRTIDKELF